jgi:hypothetical protein
VSNASSMSSEDLHAFLDRLELGHHLDRLVGEEVCSVNRLRTLSEAHLEKIGLKIGARTAILHELEKSKPSPVEQIAAVQPEIVPSSIPMETPPAPCADDDEQDMALVLPFESSIVLPTAPLVVQEFYRSFLQEKQNNVLRLGVGGYEQSGGDLAFFDYAWNFWGETGELFLFYKRYFLSTFSRDDYEKNGGDAAVRVYLRQNFRQLCFDNLAHFAQASGAPGAGSIPGGSDEVSQTAVSTIGEGNQPPSPASTEGSTIALRSPLRIPYCEISVKVFEPDEFSQATTALRKNTVSKLRVAWCNKYAFEQMLRESFFASLMLNDSLVCLDLGSEHCGDEFDSYHFRYLLDVFESRKAKPLPLRMLKLAGQPLTKAGYHYSLLCASKQERPVRKREREPTLFNASRRRLPTEPSGCLIHGPLRSIRARAATCARRKWPLGALGCFKQCHVERQHQAAGSGPSRLGHKCRVGSTEIAEGRRWPTAPFPAAKLRRAAAWSFSGRRRD